MTRLVSDAWLASSSLRLLAVPVSDKLAGHLGWKDPVAPAALAAQLVEIGKLYPQVLLLDAFLCVCLPACNHCTYV